MLFLKYYSSPVGDITLVSDGTFLTGLHFDGQMLLSEEVQTDLLIKDLPVFSQTEQWLDVYFSGEVPGIAPPIFLKGSAFQKTVWEILLQIPYGKTVTYGDIAKAIAKRKGIARMSAQAVGGAVGHNPVALIVPCHRVIGVNGKLVGYGGGIDRKRQLLLLEGNRDFH